MNIFAKVFTFIYKIKVVHSIPGRLRVHTPAIQNIPSEWQVEENDLTPVFLELNGVKSVTFSYITGNALIQYDVAVTNEKKILDGMHAIIRIVSNHRKELEKISVSQLNEEVIRMTEIVKNELNKKG